MKAVVCSVCGKQTVAHPFVSFHGCRTSDGSVGLWQPVKKIVGLRLYNLSRPAIWFCRLFDRRTSKGGNK
jgi:hypothetical protein